MNKNDKDAEKVRMRCIIDFWGPRITSILRIHRRYWTTGFDDTEGVRQKLREAGEEDIAFGLDLIALSEYEELEAFLSYQEVL